MSLPACSSIALCSHPSTPLRAASGGGLRPVLTDTARSAFSALQAGTEKRRPAEQRNVAVDSIPDVLCASWLCRANPADRNRLSRIEALPIAEFVQYERAADPQGWKRA